MKKNNIILTRIDNRLVHGQVGMTWGHILNINTLVVVDNTTAASPFAQKLMQSVASAANLRIEFYTINEFVHSKEMFNESKRIFLIVPSLHIAKQIMDGGVTLEKINVGNVHYERNRVAFNHKVYLSKDDIDIVNFMLDQNTYLYFQDVPGSTIEKFTKLDYESMKKRR